MENNIFKKSEIIDMLAQKTGFYKKNMALVADALAEIIEECLQAATPEHDSELHLAKGVVLVGRYKPACEAKDPRTNETIITPDKIVPGVIFKASIRQKLYKRPKPYHYKKRTKKV